MIVKFLVKIIRRLLKELEQENKRSYFPINPQVKVSDDFDIGKLCNIQIRNADIKLTINQGVVFREFCNILINEKAELIIERNVFFNNYCSINCFEYISIGENTLFGEGVKIYDHNHKYEAKSELLVYKDSFNTAPIRIGRNCWIGSNVTILKGVEIGDNVIVGANNLIYNSIPSNTIIKSKAEYNIQKL